MIQQLLHVSFHGSPLRILLVWNFPGKYVTEKPDCLEHLFTWSPFSDYFPRKEKIERQISKFQFRLLYTTSLFKETTLFYSNSVANKDTSQERANDRERVRIPNAPLYELTFDQH